MERSRAEHCYTSGSISRHFAGLVFPLVLGNILQQFYNTVDAAVVGRYAGVEEFAAIGVASSIMNLFLFAAAGACVGLAVLFAGAYGKGDFGEFRKLHALSFAYGGLYFLLLGLLGLAGVSGLLRVVQTPEYIACYVKSYLIIVLAGLPFSFFYNLYSAVLRSVGRAGVSLVILAGAVIFNLFLDIFFVRDLSMGVEGAAIATVLSQVVSAAVSWLFIRLRCPQLMFRRKDLSWDRAYLSKIGRYALVTALQQCGLYVGKLLVQGTVNSQGTNIIAAFTAAGRMEAFVNSFGDSGAAATAVIVAQNYGAGKQERVRRAFEISFLSLCVFGLLSSLFMGFVARQACGWLLGTASGAACDSAVTYIRLISCYYIFCFSGNTFAGYYDGIGRVKITFLGTVSHISLRVLLSYLFIDRMGLAAVAHASGIGWICVNIFWAVLLFIWIKKLSNRTEKSAWER